MSENDTPQRETVVIIGSGPAGWTAAIYAARAEMRPLVIEGSISRTMIPGGQLMFTTEVENYPGFQEGIDGPALMTDMRAQAERFGTRIQTEDVVELDVNQYPFRLVTSAGGEVFADSVIVATGANAKWLDLPNEQRLAQSGGGVSACAVCDGALPHFRDNVLAVVGGGDTAVEDALYLTKFAKEVIVVHRRDELRASKIMADRALARDKITFAWNSVVTDVHGDDVITGLRLRDTITGEERDIEVGGLFVAIGHTPNTSVFKDYLELDGDGYIVTTPGTTRTSRPGVFAAGDVVDKVYRQAVTAAGMGCQAAMDAERWLHSHQA